MNQHLAKIGYHECAETPCLYKNNTDSVWFTLVVDDFCIYYEERERVEELLRHIEKEYVITRDWGCASYLGMKIRFYADEDAVSIAIPNYVDRGIKRFLMDEEPVHQLSPLLYQQVNWFHPQLPVQHEPGPKVEKFRFYDCSN
jgi:hypothetical protein